MVVNIILAVVMWVVDHNDGVNNLINLYIALISF